MDELRDYPLASFVNGLRSAFGRVLLVALAVIVGAFLGGLTATHSFGGAAGAVVALPMMTFGSIFFAVGLITLPTILIFAFVFARYELPWWTVFIATLLMWLNTHQVIYWTLRESPSAKVEEAINAHQ